MTVRFAGILVAACLFSAAVWAQGPWGPPGVNQAGFHEGLLPGPPNPGHWHHQPMMSPQDTETLYHLLPPDRSLIYDHESPLDLSFRETLARSWIRFDYLMWNITSPGDTVIGAGIAGAQTASNTPASVRDLFLVVDSRSIRDPFTLAQVPNFDDTSLNTLNGVRGTFGIPTRAGTFEADAWVLQKSTETFNVNPTTAFINGTTFDVVAATPLTADGVPTSNSLILYNQGYQASLGTNLFGTEGNWVFQPLTPNIRTTLSPLIGFRYIRLRENLVIAGSDIPDPVNAPEEILNHRIDGRARSNVFGPQLGFRLETQLGAVTLGAEPKFAFGINRAINTVSTREIFSTTEEPSVDERRLTRFSPTFDLSLYVRVALTQRLSCFVAYDLLAVGGTYRAYDIVRYDAPANITAPPNIGVNDRFSTIVAHGLVVGGELLFR